MLTKTFQGGIFLPEEKELTVDKKIRRIPAPKEIVLPLSQHMGAPCQPLVKEEDEVRVGQRIGEAKAFISSHIHSPASGKVKEIRDFLNPVYGKTSAIIIENDEKYESVQFTERPDPHRLSKEELMEITKDAGIVGLGGSAFPTHVKLNVPKEKNIDTLIINGSECEPYLTCDHRLMIEKKEEILKGIYLVAKMLGIKKTILAIEDNKLSAIFNMEKAAGQLNKKFPDTPIEIISLKTKYPQGGEKQLIKALLGREVPPGKLPLDVGCVVQNVGTCFAIYEAVYHGKPLIERCVTLTGDALKEPGNFIIRFGTLLKDAVEMIGGFTEPPQKIIVGGPMMGVTQYTQEMPIIKGVTGIVFLSKKNLELFEESVCIRCAKCVDICPVSLLPTEIMRMVKYSRWHYLKNLNPSDCIECGSCAYLCPSRIPLVQYIKLAKQEEQKRKNAR